MHPETHVHDLDGIAFPGRVVNALTLFQKTQRLTRRIGQPLHVWVARLAQRPPRGERLLELNFTDHAARDGDDRIFGEILKRVERNGRGLTRRGNQHACASGNLRQ